MDDTGAKDEDGDALQYVQYHGSKEEEYLPAIRQLISKDLSEPYSIYVYRYFLYQWGDLCYMVNSIYLRSTKFVLKDHSRRWTMQTSLLAS